MNTVRVIVIETKEIVVETRVNTLAKMVVLADELRHRYNGVYEGGCIVETYTTQKIKVETEAYSRFRTWDAL